jgi:hypothetical protein
MGGVDNPVSVDPVTSHRIEKTATPVQRLDEDQVLGSRRPDRIVHLLVPCAAAVTIAPVLLVEVEQIIRVAGQISILDFQPWLIQELESHQRVIPVACGQVVEHGYNVSASGAEVGVLAWERGMVFRFEMWVYDDVNAFSRKFLHHRVHIRLVDTDRKVIGAVAKPERLRKIQPYSAAPPVPKPLNLFIGM